MKNSFLFYRIKTEALTTFLFALLYVFFMAVINIFMTTDGFIVMTDIMLFNMILFSYSPQEELGMYMEFGFSRSRYFKEQIILTVVRSCVMAAVRTAIQVLFYDSYVIEFMEDTDHTISMYNRPNAIELFICNIIIFMVVYMLIHILTAMGKNSVIGSVAGDKKGATLQIKYRNICKEAKCGNIKRKLVKLMTPLKFIATVIFVVIIELSIFALYWFQMLHSFVYRFAIMVGIFALFMILFFIGKYLYKPKFV